MLAVKQTEEMGRGVFAQRDFKIGDIVESCHVIEIERWETGPLSQTKINTYVFGWNEHLDNSHHKVCLALGNGSLYNHSDSPNLRYSQDRETNHMLFVATKSITAGEQLFINYGYDPHRGIEVYEHNKKMLKNTMTPKRDAFIDRAVEMLQSLANSEGFGRISKETLAYIIQRYTQKYKPTQLPRAAIKAFKGKLKSAIKLVYSEK